MMVFPDVNFSRALRTCELPVNSAQFCMDQGGEETYCLQ